MSCKINPLITVNGKQEESKLFIELADFFGRTGNREVIKTVYAIVTNKEAMSQFNLEYNEQGEPTLESIVKNINLTSLTNTKDTSTSLAITNGAMTSNKSLITFDNIESAIKVAKDINTSNKDFIGVVQKVKDGYQVVVDKATAENVRQYQLVEFHNELNNRLYNILRRLGLDVSYDEKMKHYGLFDPTDTTKTVNGLQSVIKIAKGEQGESTFPEEFAHVMISGLRNHTLVQRLLSLLNDSLIQDILGDQYEAYVKLYNNDMNLLKEEAAGQLLAAHLQKIQLLESQPSNLLQRIWNFCKDLFKKTSQEELDQVINNVNSTITQIASLVESSSIDEDFNKEELVNSRILYNATEKVNRLKEMAERAEEVASKVLLINQARSSKTSYNAADKKRIKELRKKLEHTKYEAACLSFLQGALDEINNLQTEISKIKPAAGAETNQNILRYQCSVMRKIKSFIEGYSDIINDMSSLPTLVKEGIVEMDADQATTIANTALQLVGIMNGISANYETKRKLLVVKYLKQFWGQDKTINIGANKGQTITLENILDYAEKDINFIDRYIGAMADASDPLLTLIDRAVAAVQDERDEELNDAVQTISKLNNDLIKAGYDSSFMIEKDSEGKKTGRIISDIDFEKFEKAKALKAKEISEQYAGNPAKAKVEMEKWLNANQENIILNPEAESQYQRTEKRPKKSIYHSNALDNLSEAQRTYYNSMLQIKKQLSAMIPAGEHFHTYDAIYIRQGALESVNLGKPIKSLSELWETIKDNFVRREDDTEFGDTSLKTSIHTDLSGKPLQKIPVYFTHKLKDMEMLSTDMSASMEAFAASAINYHKMREVVDALELTRDLVRDREVKQHSGDYEIQEVFRVLGKKFRKAYTQSQDTDIIKRLDDYYATVIYGQSKKDEGTWKIPLTDKRIDTAKTLDAIKNYTTYLGLGLNPFSGLSNVTMGKMQQWIESMASEYFTAKDLAKATSQYWALIPSYMGEKGSTYKTNMLSLLSQKFDAEEDFFEQAGNHPMYKGMPKRFLKDSSVLFMQGAGEHYLHVRTMLAILNNVQVKLNGQTIPLKEAFEVVKNENGISSLELKKGVTKLDGTAFTEEDLQRVKRKINVANGLMNGKFNKKDKGAIHRYALGRMVMQFRQWMPAHYFRRFQSATYDAELETWREGYYRTFGRFVWNLLKDLRYLKFNIATQWNSLNESEKANIKRALTELNAYVALSTYIMFAGPAKDKDRNWAERMALYQAYRLKMETGASIPLPSSLIDNTMTIIQSPAAAINSCNNLFNLLEVWNMFTEIQSGRYEGWTVWERDALKSIPLAGNILKTVDLSTEEYMFSMFNNTAAKAVWNKK